MKISYNWLKSLINTDLGIDEMAKLLTDCGLEVEGVESYESVKGGLKGVVVGEVIEIEKHPDADRLSLTKVNIGSETVLSIVCGAANVAIGQKVLVATVGSILFPTEGDPLEIKKSKIRGALSEGMICAEDELGLGKSHDGILVLPQDTIVGLNASEYYKIESDTIFEIGLTPNRSDAASHLGVARDIAAVLNSQNHGNKIEINLKGINQIPSATNLNTVSIDIHNKDACKRYSGMVISGVKIDDSPSWLQSRLKSIGVRPINNVVDITNFVLHELGQPLHAFDLDKIQGNKISIKTCAEGTTFKSLDEVERKLSSNDLMICDSENPLCLAGIFGGMESGVTESTQSVFLESAYFEPSFIRKSAKRHNLKTDSSFRFERGTDPEMTIIALKRACTLILEICGGVVSMDIVDVYPEKLEPYSIAFSYRNCQELIGKNIDHSIIKQIIIALGIEITHEGNDALLLNVPRFKTDVTREADVIEEVLRVYGYNHVEISNRFNFGAQENLFESTYKLEYELSNLLVSQGFNEIMSLSLTKESLYQSNEAAVKVLNPLSQDLNILRGSMIYSGLEAISYNINRKNSDLKLFEIGKTYLLNPESEFKYQEQKHLSLFLTGKKTKSNPYHKAEEINFVFLKSSVEMLLSKCGIEKFNIVVGGNSLFKYSLQFFSKKHCIVELGEVANSELKKFDINQPVFYADFNLQLLYSLKSKLQIEFVEIPKFPSVKRDLAILLDKSVKYQQIEELAYLAERKFLKEVNLFDIYQGDKIGEDKKSYAVSFTLLNEESTLTDKQIDSIMQKLITTYKEKLNAELR